MTRQAYMKNWRLKTVIQFLPLNWQTYHWLNSLKNSTQSLKLNIYHSKKVKRSFGKMFSKALQSIHQAQQVRNRKLRRKFSIRVYLSKVQNLDHDDVDEILVWRLGWFWNEIRRKSFMALKFDYLIKSKRLGIEDV